MQRVGWIRTGALGDLLVGLASLKETLELWPEAKVTVIGPKLWLQVLEPGAWPQIDRVLTLERKATAGEVYECRPAGSEASSGAGSNEFRWSKTADFRTLRDEFADYDAIFNTRVDSPREGFPAFWSRVPERWGTADGLAKWIYTHRGKHFGKDPLIHERDVPLLLMDEASRSDIGTKLRSISDLRGKLEASPRIAKWRKLGLPCPRRFAVERPTGALAVRRGILVNPTSSRREKAWPAEKFRDLLPKLQAQAERLGAFGQGGAGLVKVIGAPNETEWLREVAGHDFEIVQPKGIGELFEVVSRAATLLTNTSSVQFIAAATGTPTVTLMGRARPEVWGPLGPHDRLVRGKEPSGVEDLFERERLAYESIELEAVLEAFTKF